MLKSSRLLAITCIVLFISIQGLGQFKLTDKPPADPRVKIGRLPNGLTYYIQKNAKPEKKAQQAFWNILHPTPKGELFQQNNRKG